MVRGSQRAGGVSLGGERTEHTQSLNLQSLVSILDADYTEDHVSLVRDDYSLPLTVWVTGESGQGKDSAYTVVRGESFPVSTSLPPPT